MSKFWKVCLLVSLGMFVAKSEARAIVIPTGPFAGNRSCQECNCECMFVEAGNDCPASGCNLSCQVVGGVCQQATEGECSEPGGIIDEIIGWYGAYRTGIYNGQYDYSCNEVIDIADVIEWYVVYRNGGVGIRPTISGNPLPTGVAIPPTVTPIPTVGGCVANGDPCNNDNECCSNYCDNNGFAYECAERIVNTPIPTNTVRPPTATSVPPTATGVPPTATAIPTTPIPTMPQITRTPAPTAGGGCLVSGMSCSSNSDCCSGVCDISMAECVGDPPAP